MDNRLEQVTSEGQNGIFQSIVEAVSRTMNLPACVWVPDEQRQALRIKAAVGLPSSYVRDAFLALDEESVTGEAFNEEKVTIARDVLSDPRWKYKDQAQEMGWKSALCVPIKIHETVIGVISIYTFVIREFSDLEKQLLVDYAAQIESSIEADRRRQTLDRLLEVGREIERLVAKQPQVVLEEIVKGACEVTGADCAVLYPYDPHREDFYDVESVAAYGLNKELKPSEKPRTQKGMAAYVKREGEVVISNIEEDPAMLKSPFIKREGVQAFMGVALGVAEDVLGILYIDFRTPHQFSEEEKDTIRLFAHQAAIAIQNSRLFQEAETRAEALKKLHEVGPTLVSIAGVPESLKAILTQIAQNAQSVLGADLVDLYQYVQSRDEYVLPPIQVGKRYDPSVRKDEIYEDDVVWATVKRRRPQYVPETQQEPSLIRPFEVERPDVPSARFVIREDVKSSAAVPLIVGTEVVGVLFANYRSPQTFPQQQQELIELFASQAAIAIRNARLFEQRRTLQNIARDITSILNKDELLQTILERSLELLGCEVGAILLLDKDTNQLEYQYARGKKRGITVLVGKGLIGTTAETRKPVRVGNVTEDPRYIKRVAATRSELDVPMLIGDELVGVLNAESTRFDAFDEDSEELAVVLAGQAAVALRTAELYEEVQSSLQERIDDIRALQDIYALIGTTSLEDVLSEIAEQAARLTPAKYAAIWLLDEQAQELRFGVEYGREVTPERSEHRLPLDKTSVNAHVALTGKTYLCKNVEGDPYYQEWYEDVHSIVTTPLVYGGRVIGTLNLESTEVEAFTGDHVRLVEALAGAAAVAIQSARLYDRLDTLAAVGQTAASTLELDEVLDRILQESLNALGANYGTLRLLDRTKGELVLQAHRGEVGDLSHESIRFGQGITGWVAQHGEPFLAGDVREVPQYLEYLAGTRCELAVPIKVENRTIGVLNIEHPQPYAFDEHDMHLLEAIASQAATAIRNARLYEATQTVNEVGQALASSIRLREDEVLELIYNEASKLVDTDNLYIALYDELKDTVRFGLAFVEGRRVDVETEEGWQPRRAGKGKTEEIIRTREPLFHATKAEAEEWYAQLGHEEYLGDPLASWLGVPMMVGERVLGVIATYHPTRDYVYSSDELEILQAMANQAAIALDNVRMFYDVNRRREALVGFGQMVTSGIQLREDEVLELIYNQASKLMDTDNLYIALYDDVTDIVRFGLAFVEGRRVDVETEEGWQPRRAGKGKTEEIIRTREHLFHATKAEAEEWYAQPEHEEYVGATLPSWLGVPMMVGKRVLGVVATYHPTRDYVYSGDDLAVLQGMANQAAIALENARMFYDVNRRLEALVELGQAVTSGIRLREDEVLELIYRQASEFMDTDNMYIALYDEATDIVRFELASVKGKRVDVETEKDWQPRRSRKGKTGEIIRTKKPLFLATKVEAEEWYTRSGYEKYFVGDIWASWLGVPMMVGEKVLGVIAAYHPTRDYVYSGGDLEILQGMANQAAIALDNATLYHRIEKYISQLETVREVVNVITTELEPQTCMERILDETMKLLDAHYATILLVDEVTNELVIHAQRGVEGRRLAPQLHRIKIGEGITGVAAWDKQTIRVGNVEDVEYYLDYIVEGTRSEMATPLIEHGKVIGVLNVEDPREDAFDQDDEDLFELLAEQVVIAVQNARRVEASRKEQERLAEAERFEYLGLLAGGVAHRVGSKGGLIRLHVNNLRKLIPPEADDVHAVLDKIERENEFLIEMSDALFKPANAAETPVGPVDVNQLLNQVIRRAAIPPDIEMSFDEGDVPRVNGNRWLVEVFVELIANAARAMSESEEKKLTIRSQLIDGNSVAIVFEDSGCGIAPEEMSKVFDLFYARGKGEETPSRGGYGLWYSKSIVTRMGGDLQIESEVGKGTKCTVLLSVAR